MKVPFFSLSVPLILAIVTKYVDAGVAITGPLGNTWAAGSSHLITWTDNGDGTPMPATFNIDLMTGPLTALQLVGNVATNADSAAGQYTWSVPTTITPGKEYALRFGSPPNVAYSPYFEISAPGSESGADAAPAGGVAGGSSGAITGIASSRTGKQTAMNTQGIASSKPTVTGPNGAAKQSSGNRQVMIPSIVLAPSRFLGFLISYRH